MMKRRKWVTEKRTKKNLPSRFPPKNTLPASLARRAKGVSSSSSSTAAPAKSSSPLSDFVIPPIRPRHRPAPSRRRSDTRRAREQRASESIAASVCLCRLDAVGPAGSCDSGGVDAREAEAVAWVENGAACAYICGDVDAAPKSGDDGLDLEYERCRGGCTHPPG